MIKWRAEVGWVLLANKSPTANVTASGDGAPADRLPFPPSGSLTQPVAPAKASKQKNLKASRMRCCTRPGAFSTSVACCRRKIFRPFRYLRKKRKHEDLQLTQMQTPPLFLPAEPKAKKDNRQRERTDIEKLLIVLFLLQTPMDPFRPRGET